MELNELLAATQTTHDIATSAFTQNLRTSLIALKLVTLVKAYLYTCLNKEQAHQNHQPLVPTPDFQNSFSG